MYEKAEIQEDGLEEVDLMVSLKREKAFQPEETSNL
jgi:hypothetical protein